MMAGKGNIQFLSDDESEDEPSGQEEKKKHIYKGLNASIVIGFCKHELDNLAQMYHCIVKREPSFGQTEELSIEETRKKYSDDVHKCLERIKKKLQVIQKAETHYSKDEFDKLKKFFLEKSEDRNRQTEVYVADAESKVVVIGEKYDDVQRILQELKIHLGHVKQSNRGNRQFVTGVAKTSDHGITKGPKVKTPTSPSSNQKFSYIGDKTDFHYEEKLAGNFVLKVYSASITKLDVDVIVNAANDTLLHGGGVARVISEGAGRQLNTESRQYIERWGNIEVTKNCVTTAGSLKYKGVIHAVGPQWHDYRNKLFCMDDVYKTVYNVLLTCDQNQYRSIGMPAISAGIYGVPKVLCADMYVKAAVDFSETHKSYPKEIHFVDVDTEILKLVKNSVEKWKAGKTLDQRINVPEFLKSNSHSRSLNVTEGQCHSDSRVPKNSRRTRSFETQTSLESQPHRVNDDILFVSTVEKVHDEKFKWGGIASVFLVGGAITVKIFKGEIAKVKNLDALVCGMDRSLGSLGLLADALKKAGGTSYEKGLYNLRTSANRRPVKVNEVFTSDPGALAVKKVMHLVNDRVSVANREEVTSYREGIGAVLNKAKLENVKTVALPMIGTGSIQHDRSKLQKCCTALLQAVCNFCERENEPSITELHLINNSKEVCDALVAVFGGASEQSEKSLTSKKSPVMSGKSSNECHSRFKRKTFVNEGKQEDNYRGATGSTHPSDNIYEEMDVDEGTQEESNNFDDDDDDDDDDESPKKSDQPRKGNLLIIEN